VTKISEDGWWDLAWQSAVWAVDLNTTQGRTRDKGRVRRAVARVMRSRKCSRVLPNVRFRELIQTDRNPLHFQTP